jgi:N-acetyl-gamma-glutamyl-phosphate reductase
MQYVACRGWGVGIRVGVAGASGYAGGELIRLLSGHSEFRLTVATGQAQAGAPLAAVHPHLAGLDLRLAGTDPAALAGLDLVFLALPHGQSAGLAAQLPDSVRIVDLGADHRLVDGCAFATYYSGVHPGSWTYGLPELPGQRAAIAASQRVAGTGCYAAAVILALAPLIRAGLASPDDVVVVAASGTSGAGRAAQPHLLGSEVMGDLSPYKVGGHQHTPEIKQATGARSVTFSPVLAPMPRGILATVTAKPAIAGLPPAAVRSVLLDQYAQEPFIHVLDAGRWPRTSATLGSNACHLQATVDSDGGRIIAVSALDNLGKGAAGQAIQCANLMLGRPETEGLSRIGVAP